MNWAAFKSGLLRLWLACLLFGIFSASTKFFQPPAWRPDWLDSQWIGSASASDELYARRRFYLRVPPQSAWLRLGALNTFSLYINGRLIARANTPGYNAGVYDVGRFLQAGKNVLAVRVENAHRSQSARFISRLEMVFMSGVQHLVSDRRWRVARTASYQRLGDLPWYRIDYEARGWAFASIMPRVHQKPQSVPIMDILHLQTLRPRHWILFSDLERRQTTLKRTLVLHGDSVQGAWLGIQVDGLFRVRVNGREVGAHVGSGEIMYYFSIAPFLRRGDNIIQIQIRARQYLRRMAITGQVILAAGHRQDFSADNAWRMDANHIVLPLMQPSQLRSLSFNEQGADEFSVMAWVLGGAVLISLDWVVFFILGYCLQPSPCLFNTVHFAACLFLTIMVLVWMDGRFDFDVRHLSRIALAVVLAMPIAYYWMTKTCEPCR